MANVIHPKQAASDEVPSRALKFMAMYRAAAWNLQRIRSVSPMLPGMAICPQNKMHIEMVIAGSEEKKKQTLNIDRIRKV